LLCSFTKFSSISEEAPAFFISTIGFHYYSYLVFESLASYRSLAIAICSNNSNNRITIACHGLAVSLFLICTRSLLFSVISRSENKFQNTFGTKDFQSLARSHSMYSGNKRFNTDLESPRTVGGAELRVLPRWE
jgi:hypothetical protein